MARAKVSSEAARYGDQYWRLDIYKDAAGNVVDSETGKPGRYATLRGITIGSTREQVAKLVDFTVDSFGTVDILINSAATWNYAHLCDLPREDLERVMDTNVNGAFFLVKYVSRYMIDHKIPGKMALIYRV